MSQGSNNSLVLVLPPLLAVLLLGFGILGSMISPAIRGWLRIWVFRPFAVLIWIGWTAYLVFNCVLQPDQLSSWLYLAFAAFISWQILRRRKAATETSPERGTSE